MSSKKHRKRTTEAAQPSNNTPTSKASTPNAFTESDGWSPEWAQQYDETEKKPRRRSHRRPQESHSTQSFTFTAKVFFAGLALVAIAFVALLVATYTKEKIEDKALAFTLESDGAWRVNISEKGLGSIEIPIPIDVSHEPMVLHVTATSSQEQWSHWPPSLDLRSYSCMDFKTKIPGAIFYNLRPGKEQERWIPLLLDPKSECWNDEEPPHLELFTDRVSASFEIIPLNQAPLRTWDGTGTLHGTGPELILLDSTIDPNSLALNTPMMDMDLISIETKRISSFKETLLEREQPFAKQRQPFSVDALLMEVNKESLDASLEWSISNKYTNEEQ